MSVWPTSDAPVGALEFESSGRELARGVTAAEGVDATPVPFEFVAVTVNV